MRKTFTLILWSAALLLFGTTELLAQAPYCDPDPGSGFIANSRIERVRFNTLDFTNPDRCTANYFDNTTIGTTVNPDSTYDLIVDHGNGCGTPGDDRFVWVWIDWNRDTVFDVSTEQVMSTSASPVAPGVALATETISVTVPTGAFIGNVRMRVLVLENYGPLPDGALPCNDYVWPSTHYEDYRITVLPPGAEDLSMSTIISPVSGCDLSASDSVTVEIINDGDSPQTGFDVCFKIGSGLAVCETVGSTVAVGDTLTYTFTGTADLSIPGTDYSFSTWVTLSGDVNASNDSLSKIIKHLPAQISSFPYSESFESGAGSWITGGDSSTWALGAPDKTVIKGASDGVNAWVTGGLDSSFYSKNEASYVLSPPFDFSGVSTTPYVQMWVWWESEAGTPGSGQDGAALQWSDDLGMTWNTVGNVGDDFQWYNRTNSGLNTHFGVNRGWSGLDAAGRGSNGWVPVQDTIPGVVGLSCVQFRIIFGSDAIQQYDGFGFDEFKILVGAPTDFTLGPDTVTCDSPFALNPGLTPGTFLWSNTDPSPGTVATADGDMSLIYWNPAGILSADTINIDIETVAAPIPDFGWDTTGVCGTILFHDSTTGGPVDSYLWDFGDGTSNSSPSPGNLYTTNDTFVVTLTVTNSCHVDSVKDTLIISCIITSNDFDAETDFSIFPNPNEGSFVLRMENFPSAVADIEISDLRGSVIDRRKVFPSGNFVEEKINLDTLTKGLYFVKVSDGTSAWVAKLIVN